VNFQRELRYTAFSFSLLSFFYFSENSNSGLLNESRFQYQQGFSAYFVESSARKTLVTRVKPCTWRRRISEPRVRCSWATSCCRSAESSQKITAGCCWPRRFRGGSSKRSRRTSLVKASAVTGRIRAHLQTTSEIVIGLQLLVMNLEKRLGLSFFAVFAMVLLNPFHTFALASLKYDPFSGS
jgi:hypothetical protein